MKIIKENIDKIPLNELGLGDDVDIRIWEAMLPEMRKHLNDEPSIFDSAEAGIALVESAVIDPCLDEYWELNERGAYTIEWTEKDVSEFKEDVKARWAHMMLLANEAMNGTLNEAWEKDFKIMRMLCGEIAIQDDPAPADDKGSFPELPF